MKSGSSFTHYQRFVIATLAFLQFTVVLDFMILSPLGAVLMPALGITPAQFSLVVSVYAFSAGIAGFLTAGFADRYDRKNLLLVFYSGFVVGTLLCGLAPSFQTLLIARVVTGVFGGVVGSVIFAVIADLFAFEVRGRVMGLVQTAFASSQILGLPLGLLLAGRWNWHAPFLMIVGFSLLATAGIAVYLRPIDAHLKQLPDRSAIHHLLETVITPRYLQAFATVALLSTGGFMLMPFASAYNVHNLGIRLDQLPLLYLVMGVVSMVLGPVLGRLADRIGKFRMFAFGSALTVAMVTTYTHLGTTPLHVLILVNSVMWVGISARMISSQALMSAVPAPASRGSFMSVSSSVQYLAGGLSSMLAGLIVSEGKSGALEHFDRLGFVVVGAVAITLGMMYLVHRQVPEPAIQTKP